MTNAIEQAKREMYDWLKSLKNDIRHDKYDYTAMKGHENALESYLEFLRQDHEALHETARARYETIEALMRANQEMAERCIKMTEERDSIQLRLHAIDHAYNEQQSRAGTSGQVSGDRASCATPDAKTKVLIGTIVEAQRITTDWAMNGLRAKKAIRSISAVVNGSPCLLQAMKDFDIPADAYGEWLINNDKCMHSFFAIGDNQMKCTFCGAWK